MRRTLKPNRLITSIQSIVGGLGFMALPAATMVISPEATAQVSQVAPYYVEVNVESAYLRCGDGEPWYAVGRIDRDTLLKVDGEGFGWLRVSYPNAVGAFVRADEVATVDGSNAVRLTRPSALRAYNMNAGVNNSWKRLLSDRAATGTQMTILETVTGEGNAIEGYIVSPPDNARAFISADLVTKLSPEQAALRLEAIDTIAATNTPTNTPITPEPENELASDTTPQQTPTTTPESVVADAIDATPTDDAIAAPTSEPTVLTLEPTSEAVGQRLLTLTELHEAFQRVFQVPIEEAELQPLIDEHKAVLADIANDPDDASSRKFLDSQIQLLEIRLEVQQRLDKINDVEASASMERTQFDSRLEAFSANPDYTIVGRLATSAIYDGTTLPRLYRLLSIEDGSNRTIGYLAPNPDLDLDAKIGNIVGVVGSERERRTGAIRASVLTASRLDVLQP
ncbi:MAG: hypothetical protein ACYTF7_08050 [Planctomycetota bacterium]|jgi:hypothetical protein